MLKKRKNLVSKISLSLILLLFFAACDKAVVCHGLGEEQVTRIIVELENVGIKAGQEKEIVQNEITWNVVVDKKDLTRARMLIIEHNLLEPSELGLFGVYKEKSLIPTPEEQKARKLLAMKGEIVNSLERLPEVIDADVVINIPTLEEFGSNEEKKPTASVVLKLKPTKDIMSEINESKIQQYVANSIEDLNPRDVSVIISYMEKKPVQNNMVLGTNNKVIKPLDTDLANDITTILGIKVSKKSEFRFKIYLSIFFAVLIIISAILVVLVVKTSRMRQEFKALTEGDERPLIEGEVEDVLRLEQGEEDDRQ